MGMSTDSTLYEGSIGNDLTIRNPVQFLYPRSKRVQFSGAFGGVYSDTILVAIMEGPGS